MIQAHGELGMGIGFKIHPEVSKFRVLRRYQLMPIRGRPILKSKFLAWNKPILDTSLKT
jgi:hypothetical protein